MKMKVTGLFLAIAGKAVAECEPETSVAIEAGISKLKLVGFDTPFVDYFSSAPGMVRIYFHLGCCVPILLPPALILNCLSFSISNLPGKHDDPQEL
jgi:hypothetical protein